MRREQERAAQEQRQGLTEQVLAQKRVAPDARVPLADNPLGEGAKYGTLDDMKYSSGRHIESVRDTFKEYPERTAIIYRRSSFVSQLFGHTERMLVYTRRIVDDPDRLRRMADLARDKGRPVLLLSSRRWERLHTPAVEAAFGPPQHTWQFGSWWAVEYQP